MAAPRKTFPVSPGAISSLPGRGHTLLVDQAACVNGLLARNAAYRGGCRVLTSLFGES
jgi:hypothetical protein